jgi:isochorismate hydrolase
MSSKSEHFAFHKKIKMFVNDALFDVTKIHHEIGLTVHAKS